MYDVAIIGGGINGCGIARDAAGRGYSVFLAEKGDLASATSSGSTKLIHGGLRYLEHYEFRLVRESLIERERLWAMAPHIIWPMRFVLPHVEGLRPRWLLRLGLFIYDYIGGRKRLPPARTVDLVNDSAGTPLDPRLRHAFEYSDCWVDDARLVVLNARDAADRGATVRTRTKVVKAIRQRDRWTVGVEDQMTGERQDIEARMVINAAGPWVDDIIGFVAGHGGTPNVRLVRGSHIVVRKLFDHDRCYLFQNPDGRIFFAIPYEQDFTLIGTTDRDHNGDPGDCHISDAEIDYLLTGIGEYFDKPATRDDIVWTYSAVRPLYDDGAGKAQEATRDYVLKLDRQGDQPALLNIFGGKITTYRKLAEAVLERIDDCFGRSTQAWTGGTPLPGGDFAFDGIGDIVATLKTQFGFLGDRTIWRLARAYGTGAAAMLDDAASMDDLGFHFGAGLSERELRYLCANEWARTADDVLWRRSKLGLHLTKAQTEGLHDWFAANAPFEEDAA